VPEIKVPTRIVGEPNPIIRGGFYGEGGAGKTSLLLTFPQVLVIDTDGGLEGDAVVNVQGDEWSPDAWQDLNGLFRYTKEKVVKAAGQGKGGGYKTIGIDSMDTLCNFLRHEAENIPSTGRAANRSETQMITADQQDYGKVATAVDIFLTKLRVLSKQYGIHIVVTSAVREIDPDKGRMKRTFDSQPAVEGLLCQWCNLYGELVVVETPKTKGSKELEEHRILWTKVSDAVRKNKSRWAALRPGVTDPTFEKFTKLIGGTK
jgi:AAA domain